MRAFNPLPSVQGQLFNRASQVSEDLDVVTELWKEVERPSMEEQQTRAPAHAALSKTPQ